jgi:hypothetical protein
MCRALLRKKNPYESFSGSIVVSGGEKDRWPAYRISCESFGWPGKEGT